MGGRPALLQDDAAQALAVVVEQRRRPHGAGDDDGVFRQVLARRRVVAAEQLAQQAVGEIVEIVQALAQIGIGLAQHAGAGVRLHALDGGLGGQAGRHRLFELVHPAAVMGEHAIGFEHVAVLAALGDVAMLEHGVEVGAQRGDRGLQALALLVRVVGDEIGDDDARLVQHHVAERNAVIERGAGQVQGAAGGGLRPRRGEGGQFARRDHLRQHHGGGLERFDLLLGIGAPRAVLHHQHAQRVAGPQDRHAQEGVVDLFAGLRPIGEGRMGLGVGQVDGVRFAGDQADQAFVRAQHGLVDRLPVEAFGRVELERGVDAQHVDGANLRHHVGSDQHHDLVEAVLRADRLRHDLAKPAQQYARTSQRAAHGLGSFGRNFTSRARPLPGSL